MKPLTIGSTLTPFSTVAGTKLLIPGSTLRLTVYPNLLVVHDMNAPLPVEIARFVPGVAGPVEQFLVKQELDAGRIVVSGKTRDGFFRYTVTADSDELAVVREKGAVGEFVLPKSWESSAIPELPEKLSLGCHKKSDATLMARRCDMVEIFPIWYRLAQLVPEQPPAVHQGTASLLPKICRAISGGRPEEILPHFRTLFCVGFESLLSPRLLDDDYQGVETIALDPDGEATPLQLLVEGALLMRSLFLQRDGDDIRVLPALPPEFPEGRLLSCRVGDFLLLDLEWTKKKVRRMIVHALQDRAISFSEWKGADSCRLTCRETKDVRPLNKGQTLRIKSGHTYFLDCFTRG